MFTESVPIVTESVTIVTESVNIFMLTTNLIHWLPLWERCLLMEEILLQDDFLNVIAWALMNNMQCNDA